jgi:protein ImuB
MGVVAIREPLYFCVWIPEFPAQALLRLRPQLGDAPVAVLSGTAPQEQTCSANAKAFRLGVVTGMSRAELDSFEGVTVLRRSAEEERTARAAVVEAAAGFTPRVEVYATASTALTLVLDMSGTERIFGSAVQAAWRVVGRLKELGLFAQIAASANFHTAMSLAPGARRGPLVVAAGGERAALSGLPLAALSLTSEQSTKLELWGLRTVGELAALGGDDLTARLGQEGRRLQLLARGEHPHLFVPEEAELALEEFLVLEAPCEVLEPLMFVLNTMLGQLVSRAQGRALAVASVTVKLGLEGGGVHTRSIKPALPVVQQEVLLRLLQLDLEGNAPGAGVLSVFLQAQPGDRSKVQLGLFAPQLPEAIRLDVTLARIASLVGEGRVGRARVVDTHRPDAFTMEPFRVPVASSAAGLMESTGYVALRRYRPSLPVRMERDGERLVWFVLHGLRYLVREAYGPWRRSGAWWSSEVWSFEEWDVRAEAGADDTLLCLLSHDLLQEHWSLEALYD